LKKAQLLFGPLQACFQLSGFWHDFIITFGLTCLFRGDVKRSVM
jgi:hypothetical protein